MTLGCFLRNVILFLWRADAFRRLYSACWCSSGSWGSFCFYVCGIQCFCIFRTPFWWRYLGTYEVKKEWLYSTGIWKKAQVLRFFVCCGIWFLKQKPPGKSLGIFGATDQDWTGDLVLTMDALYQLSYCGTGGLSRIRTDEGEARRFTVSPRWPLEYQPIF